jgi:hypothetical protein
LLKASTATDVLNRRLYRGYRVYLVVPSRSRDLRRNTPSIHTSYPSEETGNKGRRQRQSVKVIRFGLSVHVVGGVEPLHGSSHDRTSSVSYTDPSIVLRRQRSETRGNTRQSSISRSVTEVAIYPSTHSSFSPTRNSSSPITSSIINIIASRLEGQDTAARTSTSILRTCSVLGSSLSPSRRGL